MQVSLNWTASTGATSYNVQRSTTSGGPYSLVASVSGTSYTDTGLTNGTTYYYVVSAVNSAGQSGESNQASATPATPVAPPPAPTNLTASAGDAQVSLKWSASTGATSYNVQRSTTSGGPYSLVASVSGTSYTDTGLTNGTTYYYVVSAANSAGQSGNSNQASATPAPGPPTSLKLVLVGHTTSSNFPVTNGTSYVSGGSTGQNGTVSVLSYNGSSATLAFSTYLGASSGGSGTQVRDVWVDPSGNIYVGGTTSDQNFPTTAGVFQGAFGGGPDDAFIAKYSPAGALLWASYLGTSGSQIEEKVYSIAGYDNNGNLTVCGRMNGPNAAIDGVNETNIGSMPAYTHAYIAKIKPDGSQLVWFTMFGGNGAAGDAVRGRCILDNNGNVYAEGATSSPNFPVTPGAFQTSFANTNGGSSGFVVELAADGSRMIWASYLGGSGSSSIGDSTTGGIALDTGGNVYVSGYTSSSNLFTSGATGYQQLLPGGGIACFIARIKSDGSAILNSTFYGGATKFNSSASNFMECMALNRASDGTIYVQGITPYKDLPTTPGSFQPNFAGGNYDGFVGHFSSDLSTLLQGTFIGGTGNETGDSSARIAFDASGNVFTALTTSSLDFPVTSGAFQSAYQGGADDQVLFGLSPDLSTLLQSTYFGGNGVDFNRSMALR
jgi:hypothetical protein